MLTRYRFYALTLVVSLALVGNASAEVILDTTGSVSTGATGANVNSWTGTPFTTGSTGATVRSIGLYWKLNQDPLEIESYRNMTIRLYTSNNITGRPDVLQGTLSTLSTIYQGTNAGILYMTDETGVTLNANTDYWFVAAPSAGTANFGFEYSPNLTYTGGLPGYTVPVNSSGEASLVFSNNQGSSWFPFDRAPFVVQMRTDVVTAVPEPSTGALAALALGGTALGVARRRRKQEAAATSEQAV